MVSSSARHLLTPPAGSPPHFAPSPSPAPRSSPRSKRPHPLVVLSAATSILQLWHAPSSPPAQPHSPSLPTRNSSRARLPSFTKPHASSEFPACARTSSSTPFKS